MNDILGQLNEMSNISCLQLVPFNEKEDVKLPNRSTFKSKHPLYVLYASQDYSLYTGPIGEDIINADKETEIHTGVKIDIAQNVELIAFAPRNRFFGEPIFMKEPEIFIDPDYRGELVFTACELYQSEFLDPDEHCTIHICKGDPICYLKVTVTGSGGLHVSVKGI